MDYKQFCEDMLTYIKRLAWYLPICIGSMVLAKHVYIGYQAWDKADQMAVSLTSVVLALYDLWEGKK